MRRCRGWNTSDTPPLSRRARSDEETTASRGVPRVEGVGEIQVVHRDRDGVHGYSVELGNRETSRRRGREGGRGGGGSAMSGEGERGRGGRRAGLGVRRAEAESLIRATSVPEKIHEGQYLSQVSGISAPSRIRCREDRGKPHGPARGGGGGPGSGFGHARKSARVLSSWRPCGSKFGADIYRLSLLIR